MKAILHISLLAGAAALSIASTSFAAENRDPRQSVGRANAAARVQPGREAYLNAIQKYAWAEGALFQVYTAPGQVTDIVLQEGEELVGPGPVAAGDTVRWIIGDTVSGSGAARRVHILVKPTRADIMTNIVINTSRRTYHLELRATPATYMASVSWSYPEHELIALRQAEAERTRIAPVAAGFDLAALNFSYSLSGDKPGWRPIRVFDDGRQLFVEFAESIARDEMPPLFVTGDKGEAELVNYRVAGRFMIVDRLFSRGELRLGAGRSARKVIIERAGRPRGAVLSAPDRETADAPGPAAAIAPESPAGFKLRTEPPSVMRLSPKSLGIFSGAASLAIGGALLYALQPAGPKVAENLLDSDSPSKSERVTGAPADYGKIAGKGDSLPGDLGHPLSPGPANGETVTALPIGPSAPPDPRDAAAEQAHLRLLEEGNAARASQVFLGGIARAASPSSRDEKTTPISVPAAPAGGRARDKRHDFLSRVPERPHESAARLSAPSSSHVVQAGSVIPAALITGIRSDLPGQITAQVTQNVYDSLTGRNLVIPQGARLIGEYDSEIAAGQSRVLLAWDRLILPGGRSIALDRLPGADAAGMAGLADRTEYHWGHMLKAALISTLLGVSAELGASDEDRLVRAARGGAQDSINETGRQVVERQLRVPPTITIRPGFTLRVIVTRDLMLEPVDGGVQ